MKLKTIGTLLILTLTLCCSVASASDYYYARSISNDGMTTDNAIGECVDKYQYDSGNYNYAITLYCGNGLYMDGLLVTDEQYNNIQIGEDYSYKTVDYPSGWFETFVYRV